MNSNEEEMMARLVRPDVVQYIAAAAEELDIDALQGFFEPSEDSGLDWDSGRPLVQKILRHFRSAAEKRAAVVFWVTY
jgi:hypothetical protein